MAEYIFEKIVFKKMELSEYENIYHIYDNVGNIIKIEANNVCDAILKSKVVNPIMVKNISSIANSSAILGNEFF